MPICDTFVHHYCGIKRGTAERYTEYEYFFCFGYINNLTAPTVAKNQPTDTIIT